MGPQALIAVLTAAIVLDMAHSVSPIVMAWMHHGFRQVMLERKAKFIAAPCFVVGASLAIGWATSAGWTGYDLRHPRQLWRITGLDNPFPLVMWLYWLWNIYHFGAQNFGVLRLFRRWLAWPGLRLVDQSLCLGVTAAGMLLLPYWIGLALISFTHWLTELALTTYVSMQRFWFLAVVIPLGATAFLWTVPPWQHDTTVGNMIYAAPGLLSMRLGLGFVHFLYDRWVWKLSDPQVRATIGRDLFRTQAA